MSDEGAIFRRLDQSTRAEIRSLIEQTSDPDLFGELLNALVITPAAGRLVGDHADDEEGLEQAERAIRRVMAEYSKRLDVVTEQSGFREFGRGQIPTELAVGTLAVTLNGLCPIYPVC
jgi:hypothetical protein